MKLLLHLLLLFLYVACVAEDNSITSKAFERDRDGDGKIDIKIETTWRKGKKIMQVINLSRKTHWKAFRSYFVDEKTVLTETDEDGDGFYEFFVVYGKTNQNIEAFMRQDNDIKPLGSPALELLQKQSGLLDVFWEKALTTNQLDANDLIKDIKEKIQGSSKESNKPNK